MTYETIFSRIISSRGPRSKEKAVASRRSTFEAVLALMVAARGSCFIKALSPKNPPGKISPI
jgi:hypothetical protein